MKDIWLGGDSNGSDKDLLSSEILETIKQTRHFSNKFIHIANILCIHFCFKKLQFLICKKEIFPQQKISSSFHMGNCWIIQKKYYDITQNYPLTY